MIRIKIAGKILDIDMPDSLLHNSFESFRSNDEGKADIVIGEEILDSDLIAEENINEDKLNTMKAEIADRIGKAFFMAVTDMGMFVLRSCAVIVNDAAYIFAAPSGEGKTTHVQKWIQFFGAEQFSDNVTILEIAKNEEGIEELFAYGYPWENPAGTLNNTRIKVAAVCFLRKHFENEIRQASVGTASELLMKNIYSPKLLEQSGDNAKKFSIQAAKAAAMFSYGCIDNKAAAKLSYRFMTGVYVRG